ncbi:t-SNARE [Parathielavia hyrcaniae]|uniref:t-SNARE n=1 Tax=Parathielavia hyrcaniae TaxID=113614 RepID=A0AAN6PSF2_9PEZI|nr:t-SNARE [Parathielavia hyrcaniae]
MSYGGYNTHQAGGYNRYGDDGSGRGYDPDPFDDRNAMQSRGASGTHEMSSFNRGSPQQGYARELGLAKCGLGHQHALTVSLPAPGAQQSQRSILNECIDIQRGIQDVENKLRSLGQLQRRALDDADTSGSSATKRELDLLTQEIMDQYKGLTDRLRTVKSNPDCRQRLNVDQVNKTDRDLRRAIQRFQELEAGSRREMQARMEREARIAHPDFSDDQIAEIVRSDNPQIFQQAVMGNRSAQANRVLGAVKQRHQEMLQIEKTLMELLEAMNEMQEMMNKQEVTVMAIDTHAEQAAGDMVKANEELEVAVTTARKTRKKKWICLGICVTIVVIIVVAVVAYVMINRQATGAAAPGEAKRSLLQRSAIDDLQMNTVRTVKISPESIPTRKHPRLSQRDGFSKRSFDRPRGVAVTPSQDAEVASKKRFVVDWHAVDPTGSDD